MAISKTTWYCFGVEANCCCCLHVEEAEAAAITGEDGIHPSFSSGLNTFSDVTFLEGRIGRLLGELLLSRPPPLLPPPKSLLKNPSLGERALLDCLVPPLPWEVLKRQKSFTLFFNWRRAFFAQLFPQVEARRIDTDISSIIRVTVCFRETNDVKLPRQLR
jgi:hypothetical protein